MRSIANYKRAAIAHPAALNDKRKAAHVLRKVKSYVQAEKNSIGNLRNINSVGVWRYDGTGTKCSVYGQPERLFVSAATGMVLSISRS